MNLLEKITVEIASAEMTISAFQRATESKEYDACSFYLNEQKIHYRKAKVTPKKEGQFVTFWKRISSGEIAPFDDLDQCDYLLIAIENDLESGFFLFPKSVLMAKNIISNELKEGKRAFRIYPPRSIPKNKQAMATQKWQLPYFKTTFDSNFISVEK